jgi:hypothetical protein
MRGKKKVEFSLIDYRKVILWLQMLQSWFKFTLFRFNLKHKQGVMFAAFFSFLTSYLEFSVGMLRS